MNKYALCLPLIFSVSAVNAQSNDSNSIIWAAVDFTPYVFVDGPNKGKGIIDQAVELLKKRLPEKQYEHSIAFNVRVFEMMKTMPNVCTGVFLRNAEREKFMEFTVNPTIRVLPNGIITTRDRRDALKQHINENGELRLDAALADGKYRLLVEAARIFGPHIDGIIRNPAVQASVITTSSTPTLESKLMKLAHQKEYDFVIGYAIEMKSAASRVRTKEEDFSFIPIAGEPSLVPIPVACSKTEIGKRFVGAVDKVLAEPAVQRELAQLYRQWLDSETAARYDKLLMQASTK